MDNFNPHLKIKKLQHRSAAIRLIISTLTSGTAAGLAQLLMVAYTFLAARLLQDTYGVMAACYSATALSSFLFNWGLDAWLLKSASISSTPLKLAGGVLRIKFLTGLVWGTGLLLFLPTLRPELFLPAVLSIVLVDTFFDSLTNVNYVTLTVLNRIPAASALLLTNRILRLASVIVFSYFIVDNLVLLVMIRMVVTILTFLIGFLTTKPNVNEAFALAGGKFARETAPFALSEILSLGYSQIDLNLVSAFTGDKTLVGNYSVVLSLVNAVSAVFVSISNVLLPVLARIYLIRSKNFYRAILLTIGSFVTLGGLLWIGFEFWGEEITQTLLGKGFLDAGLYLKMLAPIFMLRALTQTCSMIAVVINMQNQRIFPQLLGVGMKTIGGIWAFPKFQVLGIIDVYLASEFAMLISYIALAIRWYRKRIPILRS